MSGCVILVGAGPGGKGLLTLRGAEAIRHADVIVYDRLVGRDILAMMPDTAETINVGKESNHHPVPQEQINGLLVQKALEGNRVVRLKGGDCYLFGRGGEEVEALAEHGIPFEVVPGVTSALAVPAFAGIPATHRDFCSSVHIVTAHARAGGQLHIDFESLAKLNGTLVFLMGVSALEFLMNGLLHAGIDPKMPAAVIENGTRYNQRKLVADVSSLASRAVEMGLQSPAIILVGKVCALADRLDWFSGLPLHGKRIIVTRPKARMGTLSDRLRALGAGVLEFPCIETEEITDSPALETALNSLPGYAWIVLTSPAGVPSMLHALQTRKLDFRALYGKKIAVIGSGTAAALAEYGITADYMPQRFDAKHLGEGLCDIVGAGERVLLLRAAQGSPELTAALDAKSIPYDDVPVYHTVCRSGQSAELTREIAAGEVDYVTFTSASTVHGFVQAAPDADVSKFTALCIGEQTAAEAKKYKMDTLVAKNATLDDMITCILKGE